MNIERIDYHSFCSDILTDNGWGLDVGCRGFGFSNYLASKNLKVISLDPDVDIKDPENPNIFFERKCLLGNKINKINYASWSSGEGNFVSQDKTLLPNNAKIYEVECTTINELMDKYKIPIFDVIKLDCEGSEYDILMNIDKPIAKQITVEFHDFIGRNPYKNNEEYYTKLFNKLGEWYNVVQHEKGTLNLGEKVMSRVINYWDSLFVLKEYYNNG